MCKYHHTELLGHQIQPRTNLLRFFLHNSPRLLFEIPDNGRYNLCAPFSTILIVIRTSPPSPYISPINLAVYVTTASNPHESSYACYMDESLETYLGDCYSVNWMEDVDNVGHNI